MKKFGIKKAEKLKNKKDFLLLFTKGKKLYSSDGKIQCLYLFLDNDVFPYVKFAIGIHKKAGKAVWRNRAKRLIRESYRLNIYQLKEQLKNKRKRVLLFFKLIKLNQNNFKFLKLKDIEPSVVEIIRKLEGELLCSVVL